MRQLFCESGEEAILAIQNPDIELTRGIGYCPKKEQLRGLTISGGFSSNFFSGTPDSVSEELKSEIRQFFKESTDLQWLFTDIDHHCSLFKNQSSFVKIGVRFFVADPKAINAWAQFSDFFHVDILRSDFNFSGFRFIKCYSGLGTQWVTSSNVDRVALLNYINKYINQREITSKNTFEFLSRQILINHDPKYISQMEAGEYIFFKCGVKNGLVHRAPPVFNDYRIFLSITIQ